MDKDKALPSGSGIWMFAGTPKKFPDRYYHDDNFANFSSSPPPSVTREPPKITVRKSKFYSLLGSGHSPPIPEEGSDNHTGNKVFRKEQPTSSSEEGGSPGGVKTIRKCLSSPSLTLMDSDTNKISGEIIRHQFNDITTDRHDLSAPHSSVEASPSSSAVLKMFEKVSGHTVFEDNTNTAMVNKEGKIRKSQSVPVSPNASPKLRQRSFSGGRNDNRGQKSIMNAIVGSFTHTVEPPKIQQIKEETSEQQNFATRAGNMFYEWGTNSKVQVNKKDLNMYAPSNF